MAVFPRTVMLLGSGELGKEVAIAANGSAAVSSPATATPAPRHAGR